MDGQDEFDRVIPWLEHIRQRACVPGLGSHRPPVIRCAEERNHGAEFYMLALNYLRVYSDYAPAVKTINQVNKPFMAIKTLGGSAKITPAEGFTCAYTAIKRTDCIAVGVENEESIEYNADLARDILGWLDGKMM